MRAQLLDFANNNGKIVFQKIVPDGTHQYMIEALQVKLITLFSQLKKKL